tara:strand:- start:4368 stop:5528 length:1161 start_codon:yes stop_codon:yes gene_type:complete
MTSKQAKNKFLKTKKYYTELTRKTDHSLLVGLNVPLADLHYGLIDHNDNPVFPSETNIKEISSNPDVLALDFVVDAFEELQKDIEYSIQTGIVKKSSFFTKLEPVKGWKSTTEMYHKHMAKVYEAFIGTYLNKVSQHSQIKNFDGFVMMFLEFAREYSDIFPLSLSKFILSAKCSKRTSGLVVEIMDKSYNNRDFVVNKMLSDPSYGQYQRLVRKHGFKLDIGVPWRLVADIRTSKMQYYMNRPIDASPYVRYGIEDIPTLFDIYYYKAYRKDALFLKKYLISFYNHFVQSVPFSKKVCPGQTSVTFDFVVRSPLSEIVANQIYSDMFWASLYFKIRLHEEKINLSPSLMKADLRELAMVLGRSSFEQAIIVIKTKISNLSPQENT